MTAKQMSTIFKVVDLVKTETQSEFNVIFKNWKVPNVKRSYRKVAALVAALSITREKSVDEVISAANKMNSSFFLEEDDIRCAACDFIAYYNSRL